MKVKVNGKQFELLGTLTDKMVMRGKSRSCILLHFATNETDTMKMGWGDYVEWSMIDNDGEQEVEYDKSDACLLGDIVKHTDGTTSIYMCRRCVDENIKDLQDIIETLSA